MKLYRGFVKRVRNNKILQVRKDREPRNTPLNIHNVADEYFYEKFGYRFRSGSVFCTGNISQARGYGYVSEIEPIGEYKFCWSPMCKDFLMCRDYVKGRNDLDIAIKEFIERMEYRVDNLEEAINSGHEIMVFCDKFKCKNV